MPRHDDTELSNNNRSSAGAGPALLRGSTTKKRRQNDDHSREDSPASLFKMQNVGGLDELVIDLLPPTVV
jgi:hypothetical protein